MKQSKTNETTSLILAFLYHAGIFAWRQNVLPVPICRKGIIVSFRPGGKAGQPDIMGICGPSGKLIGIEVKTGKDKLRPEQTGFHSQARKLGALVLVVKDYPDFLAQWNNLNI